MDAVSLVAVRLFRHWIEVQHRILVLNIVIKGLLNSYMCGGR